MDPPDLRAIPDPAQDAIGYSRHWLSRELGELGSRVSVQVSDLTDDVVGALNDLGQPYGMAIMLLERAKKNAALSDGNILTALSTVMTDVRSEYDHALSKADPFNELEKLQTCGKLFPASGVALVRYGDAGYFIQPSTHSYGEVVHILTPAELGRIHMHNLHTELCINVSADDVGTPPFDNLIRMLGYEQDLARCSIDMDMLLNAMEQVSVEFRYSAACGIEDLLCNFPQARPLIAARLNSFIPPEEYVFDEAEVHNGFDAYKTMMELEDDDFSEGDEQTGFRPPRGSFADTFPKLHTLIVEAAVHWKQTAEKPNIRRVTRAEIQQRHDGITRTASANGLRRAQKARDTLVECLGDLRNAEMDGAEKWKTGYFEKQKLADAKGEVVLRTQRRILGCDRERFADADTRNPGMLEKYDRSIALLQEASATLISVEEVLGDIEASNFLA